MRYPINRYMDITMTYPHDIPENSMTYHHDIPSWHMRMTYSHDIPQLHTVMTYTHDIPQWHTDMTCTHEYCNDIYSRFFNFKNFTPGVEFEFCHFILNRVVCGACVMRRSKRAHEWYIFNTTPFNDDMPIDCYLLVLFDVVVVLLLFFFLLLLLLHFCTFWSVRCSPGARFNMFSIPFRVFVPNRVSWSYQRRCMSSIFYFSLSRTCRVRWNIFFDCVMQVCKLAFLLLCAQ